MTEAKPLSRAYRRERCEFLCNYFPDFSQSEQSERKRKIYQNGWTWASALERKQFLHWFFFCLFPPPGYFLSTSWAGYRETERHKDIKQFVRQYSNSSQANNHSLGLHCTVECQGPDGKQHVSLNQENLFETAWVKFTIKNRIVPSMCTVAVWSPRWTTGRRNRTAEGLLRATFRHLMENFFLLAGNRNVRNTQTHTRHKKRQFIIWTSG